MNNLLKLTAFRAPNNLTRFVHNSKPTFAAVTTTRTAKKLTPIDATADPLPIYASLLQNNLNNLIKMSRQYEKNLNGISHTQKLIQQELEKEQPKISHVELKELIYLSKTDQDLDILAKAINRYILDNREASSDYNNDFPRIFIELLYLLKKTSKMLEYFNDPSLNRIFRSFRICEIVYYQLAEANLYEEFTAVLRKNMRRYYKKVSPSSSSSSDNSNQNQKQSQPQNEGEQQQQIRQQDPLVIPVSHIDIISRFFLKQNTENSLVAFRDLIYRIERSGIEVGTFFKLRCILLAILQNNGKIAYELMRNNFCEKDLTMKLNLRVMIYSKLGRQDECLRVLKNMFIYGNKLFPFTLLTLRKDIEKLDNPSDVDFKDQVDFFFKRAYVDSRIIEGDDLPELLFGPPLLNTEVFVPVEVDDNQAALSDQAPPELVDKKAQQPHKFKRMAYNNRS